MLTKREEICIRKKRRLVSASKFKQKKIDKSFFDAPYGSSLCDCGGRVVAHGHCQKCHDEFLKEVRKERITIHKEIKSKKAELKKLWKLF